MTHVDRHRSALGEWEFAQRRSPRGRVSAFRQQLAEPLVRREIPGVFVTLIVNLGPPITVDGEPFGSFASGPYDRPAFVGDSGVQEGVQLELSPLEARRLLRVPMDELAGVTVGLDDLLDPALAERLHDAGGGLERLDAAERFLDEKLGRVPDVRPEIRWALARVERRAVGEVARELGWSHRRILREFRDHVGLPPKTVARMARFRRAVDSLLAGADLADAAYSCGYYDQAHFNRDFRDFAHTTPTGFLAERLPDGGGNSVQDGLPVAA